MARAFSNSIEDTTGMDVGPGDSVDTRGRNTPAEVDLASGGDGGDFRPSVDQGLGNFSCGGLPVCPTYSGPSDPIAAAGTNEQQNYGLASAEVGHQGGVQDYGLSK